MALRALGRGSLSSVLSVLVDIAWIAACTALGFIWLLTLVSLIAILGGGEVNAGVLARVSITEPQTLTLWTVMGTIACLGVMFIASLLKGVFATLVAGDPFVPGNARRLRRIAGALAVLELARHFLASAVNLILVAFGEKVESPLEPMLHVNFVVWAAVMILVVLAQVFDEGARLREDQKMTI
ncbi:MAG: DUF2975 domain-containing protein [Pseudomonadota bacterium]